LLAGIKEKFDRDEPERGYNPSGINPTEYKVLIDPMQVEEKVGSILLPDQIKERDKFAQTKGRIVAVSPLAFSYAEPEDWERYGAKKPKPGDVVLYAKYAGVTVKGRDGKDYTLCVDKDICATIED
jgi:co-chaperonin GroES (HSP10)